MSAVGFGVALVARERKWLSERTVPEDYDLRGKSRRAVEREQGHEGVHECGGHHGLVTSSQATAISQLLNLHAGFGMGFGMGFGASVVYAHSSVYARETVSILRSSEHPPFG